ncbi:MAG: hypothetical protein ACC645_21740, partial [Pirellulales bacterium]
GCYWVVRAALFKPRGKRSHRGGVGGEVARRAPPSASRQGADGPPERSPKTSRRMRRWRRARPATLAPKTMRAKLTELTGSMLLAAAVAVTMTVVMIILRGQPMVIEQYVWMSLIGTFGAWAVIACSKIWEGTAGDQALRRFVMLVVGLGTGALASGLAGLLLVELPNNPELQISGMGQLSSDFFDAGGTPTLLAYFAYFGFLFLVVRWWRQADPLRGARLSLWTTSTCVFWAWLLSQFWLFPQPWGLMLAAVTSIAIQLASPWVPLDQRTVPQTDG